MKKCARCKKVKPLSGFRYKNKERGWLQPYCIECNKEANKEHYRKNKQDYLAKNLLRKKELKKFVTGYKENSGCAQCGDTRHWVLDFHHEGNKEIEISKAVLNGWAKKRLLLEIERCTILCSNCHRDLHYKEGMSSSQD